MFDVPPPNEVRGKAAYGDTWPPLFKWQKQGVVFEIISLEGIAGSDVAFAHALLRCGTKRELEKDPDNYLRLTIGLRKQDGRWQVARLWCERKDATVDAMLAENAKRSLG